jgi:hypothetical protein
MKEEKMQDLKALALGRRLVAFLTLLDIALGMVFIHGNAQGFMDSTLTLLLTMQTLTSVLLLVCLVFLGGALVVLRRQVPHRHRTSYVLFLLPLLVGLGGLLLSQGIIVLGQGW